jgi:hypothetical protein
MNTPWGQSDSVEMVADGIWDVGTPSHGGVKLSCKRQALLPANAKLHNFFKTLAWWEEDCDWCVPFLVFRDEFKAYYKTQDWVDSDAAEDMIAKNTAVAMEIARNHHPEFYRWYLANRKV